MSDHGPTTGCAECGETLSEAGVPATTASRCPACFERYLRALDDEFLASYAELGVVSRRVVAETCLRALVLESPPARKVLALAVMEQFLLASADLIALYHALRNRERTPIIQSFLTFRLDAEDARAFFTEVSAASDGDLLAALGLPAPETLDRACPGLDAHQARETATALRELVRDLRATVQRVDSGHLLAELAGQVRAGPALAAQTWWLAGATLRGDQVASLVLDERRRQLFVRTVPVDEHRLAGVVDAIDTMTRAASNLIYAYLVVRDEEQLRD